MTCTVDSAPSIPGGDFRRLSTLNKRSLPFLTMIGLKTRHLVSRMSKVYPALFETVNNALEKIREVWISNDFVRFIYYIKQTERAKSELALWKDRY